ncbi:hypothetical protein PC129_g5863 [Phytophthora cactorum]|nr:hypothetical protein PC129_g5863 [Phytophthora cactorum]
MPLTVQHIDTEEMVADTMTKAVAVVKFERFHKAMTVMLIISVDSNATACQTTDEAPASATAIIPRTRGVFPELHHSWRGDSPYFMG